MISFEVKNELEDFVIMKVDLEKFLISKGLTPLEILMFEYGDKKIGKKVRRYLREFKKIKRQKEI